MPLAEKRKFADFIIDTSGTKEETVRQARALLAASSQLNDVLAKAGLERLDPVGEVFDPTAHEAVGHLPDEEGADPAPGADGPVVGQVMRAGYRWKGNVVRPAMVMVRG